MENDDYVPSDIEDNEEDDVSVEMAKPIKPTQQVVREEDNINDEDEDEGDEEGDSDLESDMDDYENIEDEDDIIKRIQKDDNNNRDNNFMIDEDDDDDDDDDDDEDYLQKISDNTKHDIIANFHPELYCHNDDEIQTLSKVVRDDNGMIIDPLHRTLPFITRYEKARLLGERAKQLNSGARAFVEVDDNVIDGYLIALKELEEKKIPFIIKRPLPNGGCEYWKLADLEILL
jgi:DNA-directed RNA polymerase I, II, and III subunit RPABC2